MVPVDGEHGLDVVEKDIRIAFTVNIPIDRTKIIESIIN
jgi:hypothetical protein